MLGLVTLVTVVLLLICSSRFVEGWKADIVGTKQFRYFGPCQYPGFFVKPRFTERDIETSDYYY